MSKNCEYYEQKELWGKDYTGLPAERERLLETIGLIPEDVQTILDVGCGNGAFLNFLPDKYKTMGIDFSREALQYVKTKTILGDISQLPFPDKSFDLITCLEVLEHLPQETYKKTVNEIERMAKKYTIISVPNKQNLNLSLIICPFCSCHFNPYYHVRSFSPVSLQTLFTNFKPVTIKEIGPVSRSHPQFMVTLYSALTGARSVFSSNVLCPQCGFNYKNDLASKNSNLGFIRPAKTRTLRKILTPFRLIAKRVIKPAKKRRWLVGLYQISDSEHL